MVVLLRAEAIPLGHDPELRADTSVPHWSSARLPVFRPTISSSAMHEQCDVS
jgi:hypothetical protein